jgi:hypothetical protein
MSFTGKRNGGPRKTLFTRKPKSRSMANRVWNTVHSVYGRPPTWMHMIPPRRWYEGDDGERVFTETTRWVISFDEDGENKMIMDGRAKDVAEAILQGGINDA